MISKNSTLKTVFCCKLIEQLTAVIERWWNKQHPKACDRTNEKPDATGNSVHGMLTAGNNSMHKGSKYGQNILHKNEHSLVPSFQIRFCHSDVWRVLLVLGYLEISVWKMYLRYFASKGILDFFKLDFDFSYWMSVLSFVPRSILIYSILAHCCV